MNLLTINLPGGGPGGNRIPALPRRGKPGGGPGGKAGGRPGGGPGGNRIPPGPIIIGGGLNISGGGTPIGGAAKHIAIRIMNFHFHNSFESNI